MANCGQVVNTIFCCRFFFVHMDGWTDRQRTDGGRNRMDGQTDRRSKSRGGEGQGREGMENWLHNMMIKIYMTYALMNLVHL